MNIYDILNVESVDRLTSADVNIMQSLLDNGQRAEVYLYYNQRTGGHANDAMVMQAGITTYTGAIGGAALEGNYQARIENPGGYNLGLDDFSAFIVQGVIDAVESDINGDFAPGSGTGILTGDQIFSSDYGQWRSLELGDAFPGNIYQIDNEWDPLFFDDNEEWSIDGFIEDLEHNADFVGGAVNNALEAGLGALHLGKRFDEFPAEQYDRIVYDDNVILFVNKATGGVDGVWDSSNIGNILIAGTAVVDNIISDDYTNGDALDVDGAAFREREDKWEFMGANGREYDPSKEYDGSTVYTQSVENVLDFFKERGINVENVEDIYKLYRAIKEADINNVPLSDYLSRFGLEETVSTFTDNGDTEEDNNFIDGPTDHADSPQATTYQLQDGDTLSQIAADNGTTVEALLAANPQITDPNAIRAGDTLVIPTQENTSPTENDQHSDTPHYNNAGNPHSDDQAAATNGQDVSGTESAIAGGYSSGGEGEFAGTPIDGLAVYDNEDQLDDSPYVASPDATPEDLANDDYDPDYDAYTDQGDSSSSYSSPGNPHYDAGDVLAEHNQAQGIGSSIATGIDNLINANNNLNDFERFALSTVLQTGTQNIISESYSDLAETMSVEEITGFEDFFDDLGSTALNVGAGMLTGAITADLVSELGWNEEWSAVAGSALNVGVGAVVDSFIAEGVGAISSVGDTFTGAYSASGIGNIGTNIVVNIATSELMESLGIGQTKTGALFATIGSIIGQIFIPIPFLGAAIGQVIGGLIGDLFSSPPPPPQAEITLSFNADTEEYEQTGGWGEHGGNPASLTGGGEHLSAMVEQYQLLLESYGGQLANRHELPDVVLGFRGNEQYIMVNGEQVGTMSEHGFKSATGSLLNEMVIEGGNSYLNHVLYSDVPPAELGDLLSSAQQRILYDNNPASKGVIDALLAEQSETMQRYDELSARQAQLESEIAHLEIEINRLSNPPRVNVDKGEWVEGEISPASYAAIARYSASLAEAHEELTNVEAGLLSLLDVEAIDAAQATLRDLHEQLEAYGQEAEISTLSADDLHALATIEGQINSTQVVLETAGASLQQAQHWHSVLAQTAPYQDMLSSEHELDDATRFDYELSYLNGIRSQNDEAQFSLHDTDLSDLVLVRDGDALTLYNRRGFDTDTPLDALPAMTFDDFGQWTNDRINLTFTNSDGEVVETSFFIGQLFDVAEQVNDGEPVDTLDMAVIVAGLYSDYLGAQMTPDEALALRFGGLGSIDTAGSRQGGAGDELLFAYSGAVYAGGGNDVVVANEAANSIDGGSGEDVVSYLHSEEGVSVNLASGEGQGGHAEGDTYENIEHAVGSRHNDQLTGDGNSNRLSGMEGDDILAGGGGGDTLIGGSGQDTADYSASGEGVNVWLSGSQRDTGAEIAGHGQYSDAQGDSLAGIEHIQGSDHDDLLVGNANTNLLWGGEGSDTLRAGGGDDQLVGGQGADRLYGGGDKDKLFGGEGRDYLSGGSGDDSLLGGRGDDALLGGEGDDVLYGEAGDDLLVGGAGDDTAVFSGRYTDYQFAVTDETLSILGADGTDTLLEMEYLHFLGDVDTDLVRVDHLMAMLKDQQREDEEEVDDGAPNRSNGNTFNLAGVSAASLIATFMAAQAAARENPDLQGETPDTLFTQGQTPSDEDEQTTEAGTANPAPQFNEVEASGTQANGALPLPTQSGLTAGTGVPPIGDPLTQPGDTTGAPTNPANGQPPTDTAEGLAGEGGNPAQTNTTEAPIAEEAEASEGTPPEDPAEQPATDPLPPITRPFLAPSVTLANRVTQEDQSIALQIDVNGNNALELISVFIDGLPQNAHLSAGTQQSDGRWRLSLNELAGLTLTPAADDDRDIRLSVSVTTQNLADGRIATVEQPLIIDVQARADTPVLTVGDAQGDEDTAIALSIQSLLTDTDGSETQSIEIANVPAGARLNQGAPIGGGVWQLRPEQLSGLTLTPPADSDEAITLQITSTSRETENGNSVQRTATLTVTVNAVADTPQLLVQAVQGDEDTAIGLNIQSTRVDTDGSETQYIEIANLPTGAHLNQGIDLGNGTWRLRPEQLTGLSLTPAANSSEALALTVTAYSVETGNGASTQTSATLHVVVNAVADAPVLTAQAATGSEDTAIALAIQSALTDTDGSETQTLEIANVPAGATLSQGVDLGNGRWRLTPEQLSGLRLTPAANSDQDFVLNITAFSRDANGSEAQSTTTLAVNIIAGADAPVLTVQAAQGPEDTAIALNIQAALSDTDNSERLSVEIANVPAGARLNRGADLVDGRWQLTAEDLSGLTLTPATNSGEHIALAVTAISTERVNGAESRISTTLNIAVDAVADAPQLATQAAQGVEDSAINLNIQSVLSDTDSSETQHIEIGNIPTGARLNQGVLQSNGTWRLNPEQLSGLTITPPANSAENIALTVTAYSTESANGDVAQTRTTLNVSVDAVSDAPQLAVQAARGAEDSAIALNIQSVLSDTDGSETQHIEIANIPTGASLNQGVLQSNGAWRLNPEQLSGLTITPPANSAENIALTVTAYSTENANGDVAQTRATLNVSVDAVADAPQLAAQAARGAEDSAIALNIQSALTDADGSETLHIDIANLPVGANLNRGTQQSDGSWRLTPAELAGLTITPPANSDENFELTVTAYSTESEGGDTAQTTATLNVVVDAVADAPVLSVQAARGVEDTAIALTIQSALTDTDGSETQYIEIANIPTGASLNQGVLQSNGAWRLNPEQLSGLTITPPANSAEDIALTVTAYSTESRGGDVAQTTATLNVVVDAVADAPVLSVQAARGVEDTAIALTIQSVLSDTDGSETQYIEIANIPTGASLNQGVLQSNGAWRLNPEQLSGLTITPPTNSAEDIALTVTAYSTENANGDVAQTRATLNVSVDAVADTPQLAVQAARGAEDSAIALNIQSVLSDTDGSETQYIEIANIPTGASLNQGALQSNGTWRLTPEQLSGLTITPPANSAEDIALTVTAYSTENENDDVAQTRTTLNITVDAVADAPLLQTVAATGLEDTDIALTIQPSLVDTDGSETLRVRISDLPTGASLNQGTRQVDGSWLLSAAELSGLHITPAPNDHSDFTLTVTAYSTESGGDEAQRSVALPVTVQAVADAPTVLASPALGSEDQAIALSIQLNLIDASEQVSIRISDLPTGSVLNQGERQSDGSYQLTAAELSGLSITAPPHSDTDFALTVTATTQEANGTQADTTVSLPVTVTAVADGPDLTVQAAEGDEDATIALNIQSALIDTDGSETLHIDIGNLPAGASLNRGTQQSDGSWRLTPAELAGLTITPPANSDEDFELTVTAYSTESRGGDVAQTTATLNVVVDAVADAPTLVVQAAQGNEDTAIALNIQSALIDTDGSETLHIDIANLPAGASLNRGTQQSDGSWRLTPAELAGLTITPPANSDEDFELTVTAYSTESRGGDVAQTTATLNVVVDAVADAPTLVVQAAQGNEDTAIALDIQSALTDTDGSETLHIDIANLPVGASLNRGTQQSDGSWRLTPAELAGLAITPPANSGEDFELTVTAYSTESRGGDVAQTTATLNVVVDAIADTPTLVVQAAQGNEDTAIALNIQSTLTDTDGSETLHIDIANLPAGASLNKGTQQSDGTWRLIPAELAGLTITPPANSDEDFELTVTAYSTESEGGDTTQTTATLNVVVDAIADTPTLVVQAAQGNEDTAIALNIQSTLTDTDGSETLHIDIANLPAGASLNKGIQQSDGSWRLTLAELTGLSITPPANSDENFELTVTAYSTESGGGDTTQTTATLNVVVDAVADAPTLTVQASQGNEDTAIALDIQSALTDTDGSETLHIDIANLPAGASLNKGTQQSDGTWRLTPVELAGLTITPPANSDEDFELTVTAYSTESEGGDTTQTTATLNVVVDAVADAPTLAVQAAQGNEDTAIALNIQSTLTDTDGSETLHIDIANLPAGASLNKGTQQSDGTWRLIPAELAGLTITPPANSDEDFELTVTAYSTESEGGDTTQTTATLNVVVDAIADTPTLVVQAAQGNEDTAIALNIQSALTDTDGSETLHIDIANLPVGASLNRGIQQSDGSWRLTPTELAGLTITPPANSDKDFALTVTAYSTESRGGDTIQTTSTLNVVVDAAADAPVLTVQAARGNEDTDIALNIQSTLIDIDGSETLHIDIGNLPVGASLNRGIDRGNGTWRLTPAELAGLTITPPANSDKDFELTVTAYSTESRGDDTAQTTATLNVVVDAVADAPTLAVQAAQGNEDSTIALNIQSTLIDTDGSETLAIEIANLPAGANLSRGIDQGNGTWRLTPAELAGLAITPPVNSDKDFELTVTAYSTESRGGDVAQTTTTLNVVVDAVADMPTLTVQAAQGNEDTAIALNIQSALIDTDGSETLAIEIANLPAGASLNRGIQQSDGTWLLTREQLTGLTVTPPANSDQNFNLAITAYSREGTNGPVAQRSATLPVTVNAVADTPTLVVQSAQGNEDTAIALNIQSALIDTDGSETLAIEIANLPAGASLNRGVQQSDGSWLLTREQLTGLTVTPPANSDQNFNLAITAYSREGTNGPVAQRSATLPVTVNAVADAPTLVVQSAQGNEDTAIALNIQSALTDTDGSESLTIVVSGLPAGARLNHGTDLNNGSWQLTPAQLSGLTFTPPTNSDQDFNLTVTAYSREGANGSMAQRSATVPVTVNAVADAVQINLQVPNTAPTADLQVSVANGLGGQRIDGTFSHDSITGTAGNDVIDTEQFIQIPISASFVGADTDGSETLSDQLLVKPPGYNAPVSLASIGAGLAYNAQGQAYLLVPGARAGQTLELTLQVTATELRGGDTQVTQNTLAVVVPTRTSQGDTVDAGAGNDTVYGGGGADILRGGAGNDAIYAGAGNDTLYGDSGADTLSGGSGNDTFYADFSDIVDGGSGSDTLNFIQSGTVAIGNISNIETIQLHSGNDLITVSNSNTRIDGGAGNNTLTFSGAGHTFNSSAFSGFTSVHINLTAAADILNLGDAGFITATSTLDGGAGQDTLNLTAGGSYDLSNAMGIENIHATTAANVSVRIGSGTDDLDIFLHEDNVDTLIGSTVASSLNINISRDAFVDYLHQNRSDYGLDKNDNGDDTLTYQGHTFTLRDIDTLAFNDGQQLYLDTRNNAPIRVGDGATFSGFEDVALTLDTAVMVGQYYDIEREALTVNQYSVTVAGDIDGAWNVVQLGENIHGSRSGTYSVSDGHNTSVTNSLTTDFQPVNDAPTIRQFYYTKQIYGLSNNRVDRVYFEVTDSDNSGDQLNITASGNGAQTPVRYSISGNTANFYVDVYGVLFGRGTGVGVNHNQFTATAGDISGAQVSITAGLNYLRSFYGSNGGCTGQDCHGGNNRPIFLDLNNDGFAFEANAVNFDYDSDGTLETGAWLADSADGVLAIDYDGDGIVTHGHEIAFADWHPDAQTDLHGLQLAFDTNQDGLLNAQDERWHEFGVWRDANSDGITDNGEFLSLEAMGIETFYLVSDNEYRQFDGVDVHGIGQFEYTDGRRSDFADATVYYHDDEPETPTPAPGETTPAVASTEDSPPPALIDPNEEADAIANQLASIINQLAGSALSDSEHGIVETTEPAHDYVDDHDTLVG